MARLKDIVAPSRDEMFRVATGRRLALPLDTPQLVSPESFPQSTAFIMSPPAVAPRSVAVAPQATQQVALPAPVSVPQQQVNGVGQQVSAAVPTQQTPTPMPQGDRFYEWFDAQGQRHATNRPETIPQGVNVKEVPFETPTIETAEGARLFGEATPEAVAMLARAGQPTEDEGIGAEAPQIMSYEDKIATRNQIAQNAQKMLNSTKDPNRRNEIISGFNEAMKLHGLDKIERPEAPEAPDVKEGFQWNPATQRYDIPVGEGKQKDRKIIKDAAGFQRYSDTGERVFPDVGKTLSPSEEKKARIATKKQKQKNVETKRKVGTILTKLDEAGTQAKATGATGAFGQATAWIQATPAGQLGQTLLTVNAIQGFDELRRLKESSPTGGALGQVSTFELDNLQAVIAATKPGMKQEQLLENLKQIETMYRDIRADINLGEMILDNPALDERVLDLKLLTDDEGNRKFSSVDIFKQLKEDQKQPAQQAQAQVAAPSGAPQAGVVEGGYRFKGGNPADQNNWEKV